MKTYLDLVNLHKAQKRFGQNFLVDLNIIHALIQNMHLHKDDAVVEIGPGLGALTRPILNLIDKITVIELDRDLIPILNQLSVDLIHQDVLTVDFSEINKNEPLRVIGNLPYNISTPIIFHLLQYKSAIKDMHFMLQKEVIDRLSATENDSSYGRLSVMVQRHCAVTPLLMIPPESFNPAPKVMSQFVRLVPYEKDPYDILSEEDFYQLVKSAFSMKRKTLRNNLKTILTAEDIENCNIDASLRAEKLSITEFVTLANYWTKKKG